jgi:hypothetical protein
MDSQAAEILIDTDESEPERSAETPSNGAADAEADDVARLVPLVEGLLFAAGEPVPVTRLVDALVTQEATAAANGNGNGNGAAHAAEADGEATEPTETDG